MLAIIGLGLTEIAVLAVLVLVISWIIRAIWRSTLIALLLLAGVVFYFYVAGPPVGGLPAPAPVVAPSP